MRFDQNKVISASDKKLKTAVINWFISQRANIYAEILEKLA